MNNLFHSYTPFVDLYAYIIPSIQYFRIVTYIILYYHKKFGHHLGTKMEEIRIVLSIFISKKVSIYCGFQAA